MIDPTLKNSNILVVDDHMANIDVLFSLLEMQGYTNIKTTTDPQQVVHLYETFAPDIILLDLTMPYLSGIAVLKQIKAIVPPEVFQPILVLIEDETTESKEQALSGGASDFITKPFDLIDVALRVKNLLYASYYKQQLNIQSQIMDNKVRERTIELERKNTELIIARDKAEASDRLKTSFLNIISHEIRTPLNGILGFGQVLASSDFSPEEKEEYLSRLNFSSERLINMVTNFIDISLLTSGNLVVNMKDFDLQPLLTEVLEKFKKACNTKGLALTEQIIPVGKKIRLHSDMDLLKKALFHLIDNAIKFTHTGQINLDCEVKGDKLFFFVKDTGVGVLDDFKDKIFSNLSREYTPVTNGHEGEGLGLSITKGIVEKLGGTVGMESEKGKGSNFYFSIPYEDKSVKSEQSNLNISGKSGSVYTILVAEDDEFNFFYLNFILKLPCFKVLHAFNGKEAVDFCHTNPEIDIVLMDLKMPEMDGFEATRQIKSFLPDLPIIAVTAYAGAEDKRSAMEAGCDEFITKPVKKELLFETMKKFGVEKS